MRCPRVLLSVRFSHQFPSSTPGTLEYLGCVVQVGTFNVVIGVLVIVLVVERNHPTCAVEEFKGVPPTFQFSGDRAVW